MPRPIDLGLLGVTPQLGRDLEPADDVFGAPLAACAALATLVPALRSAHGPAARAARRLGDVAES